MSKREKPTPTKKLTKTYLFRLYPTRKQTRTLEEWLGWCCQVYNAALDERRSAYRLAGVSLCYEDQCRELPGCKEVRPELAEVPSQVLQDVVKRVDLAFERDAKASYRQTDSHREVVCVPQCAGTGKSR